MNVFDLAKLAGSNLWRRRVRTALTVLGVVIGTACIIVMIALGRSNIEQTKAYFEGQNLDIIQVTGGAGGNAMGGARMSMGGGSGQGAMNDNTIKLFQNLSGVKAASGVISFPMQIKMGKYETNTYATAMEPAVMGSLKFKEGKKFADSSATTQIIMGEDARLNFQDPKNPVDFYANMDYDMYGMPQEGEEEPQGPQID